MEVVTPLGFRVRVTQSRWEVIIGIKHPVMKGQEREVLETLRDPDQIRRSKRDQTVFLFYRAVRPGRWTCVVTRRLNDEGFLVTAYPTDAIKQGEQVWSR